jgi:hypothetical protein
VIFEIDCYGVNEINKYIDENEIERDQIVEIAITGYHRKNDGTAETLYKMLYWDDPMKSVDPSGLVDDIENGTVCQGENHGEEM